MLGSVGPGVPGRITVAHNDYSLSDEQSSLVETLDQIIGQAVPPDAVRAAEPLGFDAELWRELSDAAVTGLALPTDVGGQGAGLLELALAAEALGRVLAPVPLVEHTVCVRALATLGYVLPDDLTAVDEIVSLAPCSDRASGPHLVPAGSVARMVLVMDAGRLLALRRNQPPGQVRNQGDAPLAWWSADDANTEHEELLRGDQAQGVWQMLLGEWRIATAALLVGLADGAARLARTYAVEREAFGRPIARFQAVSHTLVDQHTTLEPARNLARKAAWFHDHDPRARPELPAMALTAATRAARTVSASAVHVHGGLGVTREADVSLYYRRAAAWSQPAGGTQHLMRHAGRELRPRLEEVARIVTPEDSR